MKRAGKPSRWAVFLLRKKAERLGTVEAAHDKAALAKAFELFKNPGTRAFPH